MRKKVPFILGIFAILLLGVGLYFNYLANPKRIVKTMLQEVSTSLEHELDIYQNILEEENFTMNTDFSLQIESEYLTALAKIDSNSLPLARFLENISKMKTNLSLSQNKKEEKLLVLLKTSLDQKELGNLKFYIENDKQYYLLKDISSTYFDGGSNTYFQTLDAMVSKDEFYYVYQAFVKALENAIKESYFDVKTENSLYKITLEIDEERMEVIQKEILNDLKKDKKAYEIITKKINPYFFESLENTTSSKNFGEEDESILLFEIYTNQVTYEVEKCEVKQKIGKKEFSSFIYEKKEDVILLSTKTMGRLTAQIELKKNGDTYDMELFDGDKKKIGTAKLILSKERNRYEMTLSEEENVFSLSFDLNRKQQSKTAYDVACTLSFALQSQQATLIKGNLQVNGKVNLDKANIKEDVTGAVPMNEEQTLSLGQKFSNALGLNLGNQGFIQ